MKQFLSRIGVNGLLLSLLFGSLIATVILFGDVIFDFFKQQVDEGSWWKPLLLTLLAIGWIVAMILLIKRSKKRNAAIGANLMQRAEREIASVKTEKRPELEELRNSFKEGIDYLDSKGIGLDTLPWYLIIGPPGNGKTTLVRESGFNFAGFKSAQDYYDPTRNCGWFFSDDAVFIDTAGRYAAGDQAHDSSGEWLELLQQIKSQRKQRPINGLIVAVSMFEFAGEQGGQRAVEYSESLRSRVVEIMDTLGTRIPVYVVFTMCDLMEGFVDFFSELTPDEMDAWWGVTLEPNMTARPGTLSDFDPLGSFDEGFATVVKRLHNRRFHRFSTRLNRRARHASIVFQNNILSVREHLQLFVEKLFRTSRFDDDLLFRGFYFTSGTQTERPSVDLSQSLSSILGLPAKADVLAGDSSIHYPEKKDTHSYFVRKLFTDVMLPDRYMAHPTTKAAQRQFNSTTMYASLAGVLLLGAGFFMSSCRSNADTQLINSSIDCSTLSQPSTTNELRSNIENHYAFAGTENDIDKPFLSFGVYKADELLSSKKDECQKRFNSSMEYVYNKRLLPVVGQLASLTQDTLIPDIEKQKMRATLLLGDPDSHPHLADMNQAEGAFENFTEINDGNIVSLLSAEMLELAGVDMAGADSLQSTVYDLTKRFVESIAQERIQFTRPDKDSIRHALSKLTVALSKEEIYDKYLERLSQHVKEISDVDRRITNAPDLLERIGLSQYTGLFNDSTRIKLAFTMDGWKIRDDELQAFLDQWKSAGNDWFAQRIQISREDLGLDEVITSTNTDEYFDFVSNTYERQYPAEWNRFLENLAYTPVSTISGMGERIESITAFINEETTWELHDSRSEKTIEDVNPVIALLSAIMRETSGTFNGRESNFPHLQFIHSNLSEASVQEDWKSAATSLATIAGELSSWDQTGQRALDLAKVTLGNNNGLFVKTSVDFRNAGNISDSSLPQKLLRRPIYNSWGLVMRHAEEELNELWNSEITTRYDNEFRNTYPFALNATSEAPLNDFEEFFGNVLHEFRNEHLEPLLEFDGADNIKEKRWPNPNSSYGGLSFVPGQRIVLQRGIHLGKLIGIGYDVKMVQNSQAVRLAIEGDEDINDEQEVRSYEWPSNRSESSITLRRNNRRRGSARPVADKDWAIFKFVYGSGQRVGTNLFEFKEDEGHFILEITTDRAVNPFEDQRFFEAFKPQSRLFLGMR